MSRGCEPDGAQLGEGAQAKLSRFRRAIWTAPAAPSLSAAGRAASAARSAWTAGAGSRSTRCSRFGASSRSARCCASSTARRSNSLAFRAMPDGAAWTPMRVRSAKGVSDGGRFWKFFGLLGAPREDEHRPVASARSAASRSAAPTKIAPCPGAEARRTPSRVASASSARQLRLGEREPLHSPATSAQPRQHIFGVTGRRPEALDRVGDIPPPARARRPGPRARHRLSAPDLSRGKPEPSR
jgi:hypothetical protein